SGTGQQRDLPALAPVRPAASRPPGGRRRRDGDASRTRRGASGRGLLKGQRLVARRGRHDGPLPPGGGAVDGVDDALAGALPGEHLDDTGVERVADVLAEEGVEPDHDVRGLVVGGEDVLERTLLDDALRLLAGRQGVERLRVALLVLLLHEEVEEGGALLHRRLRRAGEAVDAAHHRGGVAGTALDGGEGEP